MRKRRFGIRLPLATMTFVGLMSVLLPVHYWATKYAPVERLRLKEYMLSKLDSCSLYDDDLVLLVQVRRDSTVLSGPGSAVVTLPTGSAALPATMERLLRRIPVPERSVIVELKVAPNVSHGSFMAVADARNLAVAHDREPRFVHTAWSAPPLIHICTRVPATKVYRGSGWRCGGSRFRRRRPEPPVVEQIIDFLNPPRRTTLK